MKSTSKPVKFLLLGTIRYLGLNFTYNDLKEGTYIACKMHCMIFRECIVFEGTILFPKYVSQPITLEQITAGQHTTKEFERTGCHRDVGSVDGVQILC